MNTFLPYSDFEMSAKALDQTRLWKQVLECDQIEKSVILIQAGAPPAIIPWRHHPAVVQWSRHLVGLVFYRNVMLAACIRRGIRTTKRPERLTLPIPLPSWIGDEAFHASHRSNLLRKDPAWYGQFGWIEPHDLPYIWPSKTS